MDDLYKINDLLTSLNARDHFPSGEDGDEEYDQALNDATLKVAELLRFNEPPIDDSLARRHQAHYTSCNCLADAAECCEPACSCHNEHDDQQMDIEEPLETHTYAPPCIGQWCCDCEFHPIGKPWGWNSDAWDRHYAKAHSKPWLPEDKKSET